MKTENEALSSVLNDKAFLENVAKMDIKSAQKAFEKRGVKLTTDEMIMIKNLVEQKLEHPELTSDKVLEKVSGGHTTSEKIKNIAYAISSLVIAGTVAAVGYKTMQTLDKVNKRADAAKGKSAVRLFFWGLPTDK